MTNFKSILKNEPTTNLLYHEWVATMQMAGAFNCAQDYATESGESFKPFTEEELSSKNYHTLQINNVDTVVALVEELGVVELNDLMYALGSFIQGTKGATAYKKAVDEVNANIEGLLADSLLNTSRFTIRDAKSIKQARNQASWLVALVDMALRFTAFLTWLESKRNEKERQDKLSDTSMTIRDVIVAIEGNVDFELNELRAKNLLNMASRMLNKGDETAHWTKIIKFCLRFVE